MFPNGVLTAQGVSHASNSVRVSNIFEVIRQRYLCNKIWEGDMAGTYNGTIPIEIPKQIEDLHINVKNGNGVRRAKKLKGCISLDKLRDILVAETTYGVIIFSPTRSFSLTQLNNTIN